MINSDELIGFTEYLTLKAKCRINRVLLYLDHKMEREVMKV